MNSTSQSPSKSLPPTEYILKLHAPEDKITVLILNRGRGQTLRRVASVETVVAPEFQNWLRGQNRAGSDVYVAWN